MSEAVLDNLPGMLLRFYDDERYARLLVEAGTLRMRPLAYFRSIEGARSDGAEGESHLLVPGEVPVVSLNPKDGCVQQAWTKPGHLNYHGSFVQPTYVYCASSPTVDVAKLRRSLGTTVVRILDPKAFGHALHAALEKLTLPESRKLLFLSGCRVSYDKGLVGEDPRRAEQRLRIHFAQKPPSYAHEEEYRFAAALSGPLADSPPFLDVQLNLPGSLLALEDPG